MHRVHGPFKSGTKLASISPSQLNQPGRYIEYLKVRNPAYHVAASPSTLTMEGGNSIKWNEKRTKKATRRVVANRRRRASPSFRQARLLPGGVQATWRQVGERRPAAAGSQASGCRRGPSPRSLNQDVVFFLLFYSPSSHQCLTCRVGSLAKTRIWRSRQLLRPQHDSRETAGSVKTDGQHAGLTRYCLVHVGW